MNREIRLCPDHGAWHSGNCEWCNRDLVEMAKEDVEEAFYVVTPMGRAMVADEPIPYRVTPAGKAALRGES